VNLDEFLARLEHVKKNMSGWMARCPAHDDAKASLSIGIGDDERLLVKCQAGCDTADVLARLDLTFADLFEKKSEPPRKRATKTFVAVYQYVDAAGELLYEVCRTEDKQFKQRRSDGNGGHLWNLQGVERVLYRLPRVLEAAAAAATIYLCEGEKDVHALEEAGVVASCNPMGAGKWQDGYAESLRGASQVVIVADRDKPGRDHAHTVKASLRRVASVPSVIVEAAEGKDAADHLAAGKTLDEFVPLVDERDPIPDLAELLDELTVFVRRFVVLNAEQLAAVALWIVHTHALDAADTTPYLAATSAEKRSGKTRLLEVLELLARKPLPTANISDAALFRAVATFTPALLFDEVDAIFGPKARDREDLRGMLNAGYRRGASVYRMGGANMTELESFPVFCAKVFAGIGTLPDTISDRSIPIRLERRTSDETIDRFRRREVAPEAKWLRERISRWTEEHVDDLIIATPHLPDELDDRAQDVWEPLLAIADHAGGEWPQRARTAAVALSSGEAREDESLGARLLADIQAVFGENGTVRYRTADLIEELAKIEESPWGDWYGKTISPQALGKLLKPYRIKTMPVWVDGEKCRGYKAEQFEEAWARVLGGRGGRGGRRGSNSDAPPTTPTTPTTYNAVEGSTLHLVVPDLPDDAPEWERAYWVRRREAAES
jgi:5S rRNA maturation endonuclease (ribonuclease M5)